MRFQNSHSHLRGRRHRAALTPPWKRKEPRTLHLDGNSPQGHYPFPDEDQGTPHPHQGQDHQFPTVPVPSGYEPAQGPAGGSRLRPLSDDRPARPHLAAGGRPGRRGRGRCPRAPPRRLGVKVIVMLGAKATKTEVQDEILIRGIPFSFKASSTEGARSLVKAWCCLGSFGQNRPVGAQGFAATSCGALLGLHKWSEWEAQRREISGSSSSEPELEVSGK